MKMNCANCSSSDTARVYIDATWTDEKIIFVCHSCGKYFTRSGFVPIARRNQ